jgi:hypothetical protein
VIVRITALRVPWLGLNPEKLSVWVGAKLVSEVLVPQLVVAGPKLLDSEITAADDNDVVARRNKLAAYETLDSDMINVP